jgi:hypothetical protein
MIFLFLLIFKETGTFQQLDRQRSLIRVKFLFDQDDKLSKEINMPGSISNRLVSASTHVATPKSFGHSVNLNRNLALPNALPSTREIAATLVGHYPIFSAKGWLSLNWLRGCDLGCAYCFRPGRNDQPIPVARLYDEEFVADYLFRHDYFVPSYPGQRTVFNPTILGMHTSSTEPFLPGVKDHTFRMIELLGKRGIDNPLVIVSKWFLSDEEVAHLKSIVGNLRLQIMSCYSAMPPEIEPVSTDEIACKKIGFMKALAATGNISVAHYYRPIAIGWNDGEPQIRKALEYAREGQARAIIAGGVGLWDQEVRILEEHGLPFPEAPGQNKPENRDKPYLDLWHEYGFRRKYFPKALEEQIISMKDAMGITTPLFRRASCGVNFLLGSADHNAYRMEGPKNCTRSCPAEQVALCEAIQPPSPEKVAQALAAMKIINPPNLEISGSGLTGTVTEDFSLLDAFNLRHWLKVAVELKKPS